MLRRSIILLALVAWVAAQDPLDAIIDDVFKPSSSPITDVDSRNPDEGYTGNEGGDGTGDVNGDVNGDGGTGNDDDCICVPYYLCANNTIVVNGVGLIDIRIKPGPCDNYLDVCCKKPFSPECNPDEETCNSEPDPRPRPPPPPPRAQSGCGQRNAEGVGFRITGDSEGEAQFGEFPWMVALLREEQVEASGQKLNVYQCGGSLINYQVVLTAAHCVAKKAPRELKIRAGEWDTQTKNELFPHQDRLVKNVIIHEGYYPGALYNDIALLILEHPVDEAENVDIVCLPNQGEIMDNKRCFASGWGKDVFGKEGRYQVILKKVELPVVPRPKCLASLRKTRLGQQFKLHESFICAGGEPNKDTCKGDGGSPLVCPITNDPHHYAQAGIVAWGIGCGENQTPGVYANVAQFRHWIDQKMALHNFDTHSYSRP